MKVLDIKAKALVEVVDPDALRKKLTLTSTGHNIFTIDLYKDTEDYNQLWIPRSLVASSECVIPIKKKWKLKTKFKCNFSLWEDQAPVVQTYLDALKTSSPYGGIISCQTGGGKTQMAMNIASGLGMTVLVVVPTDKLVGQWKDRLIEYTDLTEDDIGIIQQNRCEVKGKKVVLGMLHSLTKRDYPKEIYDTFGFMIYDEVHVLGAETFSRVAGMFYCKWTLGLSATVRRKDGMANAFFWNIGPIVVSSHKVKVKPKVILYPYKGQDAHHNGCFWNGNLSLGKYHNKLAKSQNRTTLIGDILFKLYNKGKEILVLGDRIEMLNNLKEYLIEAGVPTEDVGLFTASHKQTDARIVLATYGSAALGHDDPRLNALVFISPRTDIEQAIGRVKRLEGTIPIVIDIVDTASIIMQKWAHKRKQYYMQSQCEIIDKAL